jgi:hypothetical protein
MRVNEIPAEKMMDFLSLVDLTRPAPTEKLTVKNLRADPRSVVFADRVGEAARRWAEGSPDLLPGRLAMPALMTSHWYGGPLFDDSAEVNGKLVPGPRRRMMDNVSQAARLNRGETRFAVVTDVPRATGSAT